MRATLSQVGAFGAAWIIVASLQSALATAQYFPQPTPGGPLLQGWQQQQRAPRLTTSAPPGTTYRPPPGGYPVIPQLPPPGTTYRPPPGGYPVIPQLPPPGTTYRPPPGGYPVIPQLGGYPVIPQLPPPLITEGPPPADAVPLSQRPNPPRVGVLKISDWIRNIPSSIKPRPLPRKPAATKIDAQRLLEYSHRRNASAEFS